MSYAVFRGNCPGNVRKDAKYAIRSGPGGPVVALTYDAGDGEKWHVTQRDHPELVRMVNAVKLEMADRLNGPFYINEYRQVIVPAGPSATYYLAGEYANDLEFDFEGKRLTGRAVALDGTPLRPGDTWIGPHAGIPYVLNASGTDVYFETEPRPNVTKRFLLSAATSKDTAASFARRLRSLKGFGGGRFYVNEWRELFAPLMRSGSLEYIYAGPLSPSEPWFPKPVDTSRIDE